MLERYLKAWKTRRSHGLDVDSKETLEKKRVSMIGKNKGKKYGSLPTKGSNAKRIETRRKNGWWKNPEEKSRKTSISNTGKVRTSEMNSKNSDRVSQSFLEGKMNWNIKGYFYSLKNNKNMPYRSSYELIAFRILEALSAVISYEYEVLKISYLYQGSLRYTVPDLVVHYSDGTRQIIEIKSMFYLKSDISKAKVQASEDFAKRNNYRFSLWTEKELGIA